MHGPYEPENGHRFNPNKLLLDPYAKAHVGELKWDPAVFGYTLNADGDDLTFDERDSAPFVQKCPGSRPEFFVGPPDARSRPLGTDHLLRNPRARLPRNAIRLYPSICAAHSRDWGTKEVIEHIKSLGVTSVELLPIQAFVDDSHLTDQGLTNYWGYNTIGFFAADPRFFAQGPGAVAELKQMIDRFHETGLEIILDVVYNHTAEGNERGPTLSFKGIDNASYYRLPDDKRYYINDTGTGNTLNLSHPRVLQMVTDSLRYWVTEMNVTVSALILPLSSAARRMVSTKAGGFLDSCRQDPILSSVKLIAEPWDCGPGGYQVGGFPPGWAEWNDKFRDTVREFWKGEEGVAAELATRITGSGDKFNHRGRRPWASVNFITAHDGFTLNDLVSYNEKHNEANGEDNKDGSSDNRSWNCGAEGPTDDPEIRALRERQKRNMLATLLFSQGTPMILAGDEFGRTQQGQ